MTKEIQFRRGSTSDHISGAGFTGAVAEVTVDTTNNTLRVHDGVTKGGHESVGVAVTQTISNKNIQAINLNASGVSTFTGIGATTLNVSGFTTVTSIGATTLRTTGIATLNSLVVDTTSTFNGNVVAQQNLQVYGSITVGGTTVTLNTQQLQIEDSDIILGIGTTFASSDTTANHGGIAIASTEGTPLVDLNIVAAETNPSTYKKIMWFKSGTATGLNTDAWLFNYGVGIGSTQIPNGVRLAAGSVQFTQDDLSVVRNINVSGVSTLQSVTIIGGGTSTGTVDQPLQVTGGAYVSDSVGIGTTNPAPGIKLDVVGGEIKAGRVDTNEEGGQVSFGRATDNTTAWYIDVFGSTSTPSLRFIDVSNSAIRSVIDGSGNFLINTASATGTASQSLQVSGGAYFSGSVGIGTTNPTARLQIPPGSATANTSPLKFAAGPLLTNAEVGAIEFDGDVFYATANTANGRGMLDATQYYRLNANRNPIGVAITNYFGNTGSTLTLPTNGIYLFDYHLYYTKTTNGTVTYTLVNTQTVTNMVAVYEHSNFAGITTTADASALRGVVTQTAASVALPVTPTIISGSNNYANIRVLLENATSTGLALRVTCSAGTLTPLRGSWYSVRELPSATSVGIFT
jgi:hypothetical protein